MDESRAPSVSGTSGITETTADDAVFTRKGDGVGSILTKEGGARETLFKTLYALGSQRYSASWKYAIVALVFPYLVLIGLLLGPQFHWSFEGSWMGALAWLDLTYVEHRLGYSIFQAIVFATAGVTLALAIAVLLLASIHARQRQPWKSLVHVTVFLRAVLLELLYVPALAVLLSPLACDVIHAHTQGRAAVNKIFTDHTCYAGSGVITTIVAYFALPILMLLALGNSLGDFDPNMLSTHLLAAPSSQPATAWTIGTAAMVTCMIIWRREGYMAGGVTLVIACAAIFGFVRNKRFYRVHVNAGSVGLLSALAWVGLTVLVLGLVSHPVPGVTIAMAAGAPVAYVLGHLAMRRRAIQRSSGLWQRVCGGFDSHNLNGFAQEDAFKLLQRPADVEICARVVRIQDEFGNYDPNKQAFADAVLKYGLQSFPDSAFLVLQYANFLRTVRKDLNAATAMISKAEKIPAGLNVRLAQYWVERDHKLDVQDRGLGADGAMDTASFMEFSQALKTAETSHQIALRTTGKFWRLLLCKEITFSAVTDISRQMAAVETSTAKMFKTLSERYPNNVKLLRSYAKYTEEVTGDPHRAMRLYNEADKIEDLQEERKRDQLLSSAVANGAGDLSEKVDDQTDAVIVINDAGIVQMTNKLLNQTLGYKAGELDGLNVSVIMPPPFAQRHNGYLRAAKAGSQTLNRPRKVLAVRKDKSVLPMDLKITRMSQGNESTLYLGVLHAIEDDDGTGPASRMIAWLTTDGNFIAVNRAFASVTGFNTAALQGQTFQAVGAAGTQWDEHVAESVAALQQQESEKEEAMGMDGGLEDAAQGEDQAVELQSRIRHKFGRDVMRVRAKIRLVGVGDGTMAEVELELTHAVDGIAVYDLQGKVQYSNHPLARILGYEEGTVDKRQLALDKILPSPLAQFHVPLLKAAVMSGEQPASHIPCFHGHTVLLEGKDHAQVPVRLQWWPQRINTTMTIIVSVHPVAVPADLAMWGVHGPDALLESSVCMQLVASREGVIAGAGCGLGFARNPLPGDVFGVDAAALRGHLLSDYIDVFQALVQNGQLYSKVKPREVLASTLTSLARTMAEGVATTFRGSLICASKTGSVPDYVPVRFAVEPLADSPINVGEVAKQGDVDPAFLGLSTDGKTEGFLIRVWSANWVNGHVGVARDGTIRTFDRASEILFGIRSSEVMGAALTTLLTNADVLPRTEAKQIRIESPARHSDGSQFKVSVSGGLRSVAGAQEVELLVQASLEEPVNSIDSLKRLEMMIGRQEDGGAGEARDAEVSKREGDKAPPVVTLGKKKGVAFAPQVKFSEELQTSIRERKASARESKGEAAKADKTPAKDKGKDSKDAKAKDDHDSEAMSRDDGANSGSLLSSQLRKAKRYRRLRNLLEGCEAALFASTVTRRITVIVFAAIAVHVILFAVYCSLVLGSRNLVSSVFTAGQTTLLAGSVGTDVESEEAIFNSDPIHGRADLIWDGLKATMETSALQLESVSRAMYVTSKLQHIKSAVRDMLYETPNIQVQGHGAGRLLHRAPGPAEARGAVGAERAAHHALLAGPEGRAGERPVVHLCHAQHQLGAEPRAGQDDAGRGRLGPVQHAHAADGCPGHRHPLERHRGPRLRRRCHLPHHAAAPPPPHAVLGVPRRPAAPPAAPRRHGRGGGGRRGRQRRAGRRRRGPQAGRPAGLVQAGEVHRTRRAHQAPRGALGGAHGHLNWCHPWPPHGVLLPSPVHPRPPQQHGRHREPADRDDAHPLLGEPDHHAPLEDRFHVRQAADGLAHRRGAVAVELHPPGQHHHAADGVGDDGQAAGAGDPGQGVLASGQVPLPAALRPVLRLGQQRPGHSHGQVPHGCVYVEERLRQRPGRPSELPDIQLAGHEVRLRPGERRGRRRAADDERAADDAHLQHARGRGGHRERPPGHRRHHHRPVPLARQADGASGAGRGASRGQAPVAAAPVDERGGHAGRDARHPEPGRRGPAAVAARARLAAPDGARGAVPHGPALQAPAGAREGPPGAEGHQRQGQAAGDREGPHGVLRDGIRRYPSGRGWVDRIRWGPEGWELRIWRGPRAAVSLGAGSGPGPRAIADGC